MLGKLAKLALLAAALAVAGCGFQLRSWDLSSHVASYYIQTSGANALERPLGRALEQAGVEPAESPGAAALVVTLHQLSSGRRGVSVTPRARVAEYALTLSVSYSARADGEVLLRTQTARSRRVYQVDSDNVVGSSEEQALLEREMQSDLVQQILRAVDTVIGGTASASSAS